MKRLVAFLCSFLLLSQPVLAVQAVGNGSVGIPVSAVNGGLDSASGPTGITKVICFGDSTCANTAGSQVCYSLTTYGTPVGTCLLDMVALHYSAQAAQLGIGGTCNQKTTTASSGCNSANSGISRYNNANTAGNPGFSGLLTDPAHTLVMISYTLNDAIKSDPASSPVTFGANLGTEVAYVEAAGVPSGNIVILGPSPVDAYGGSSQYFPEIPLLAAQDASVARQYNTRYVDAYTPLAGCYADGPYQLGTRCDTDGLHPSSVGEAILAPLVYNSTYSSSVAGMQASASLAAVYNQPLALGQRRLSPYNSAKVSGTYAYTGTPPVALTQTNPYDAWFNSANTEIDLGPLNDSLAGVSGLLWEIKSSSPLFTVDGSGNVGITTLKLSNALGVAYGGTGSTTQNFVDLTSTQTVAGAKTFSNNAQFNGNINLSVSTAFIAGTAGTGNTNGVQISNASTNGGSQFTRIAAISSCGSLSGTSIISVDDMGAGYKLCLGQQGNLWLNGGLLAGQGSVTAYPWHPSSDPQCTVSAGGTSCNTTVTVPNTAMRCTANDEGTALGGIGYSISVSAPSGTTVTITYGAVGVIAGGGTATFSVVCN